MNISAKDLEHLIGICFTHIDTTDWQQYTWNRGGALRVISV